MVKAHASISSTKQSQEYHGEVYSANQDMTDWMFWWELSIKSTNVIGIMSITG